MFLPMLVACFAAMLASTLLRDAPIYDSLREHTLHRERVLWQKTQKKVSSPLPVVPARARQASDARNRHS
jgi:hypothetical protein